VRVTRQEARHDTCSVTAEGDTLGRRTVRSEPYKAVAQVRAWPPSETAVRLCFDALLVAAGKLSPGAVAAAAQSATGKSNAIGALRHRLDAFSHRRLPRASAGGVRRTVSSPGAARTAVPEDVSEDVSGRRQ